MATDGDGRVLGWFGARGTAVVLAGLVGLLAACGVVRRGRRHRSPGRRDSRGVGAVAVGVGSSVALTRWATPLRPRPDRPL
jgi:hypothetical protein